jgi:glycosyltransferase involved in cell wall biosynthesis
VTLTVGVVVVTHNSEDCIQETWASILAQTYPIARITVVDDNSTDGTLAFLRESAMRARVPVEILRATSTVVDVTTRIAQNFTQGLLRQRDLDAVALSDHDDYWHAHRLKQHVGSLLPGTIVLAGNGTVGGSDRTLFGEFDVPTDMNSWDPRRVLRHTIRRSVVTGGASMVRPSLLCADYSVLPPKGWLHDRWWSLIASSRMGLRIDTVPVIDYRVSEGQRVGLDRGRQTLSRLERVRSMRPSDFRRVRDLAVLRRTASPGLSRELSPTYVLALSLG